MRNLELVKLFGEMAKLVELDEGSPQAFRVRAYQNAARAIEGLGAEVETLSATELAKVKGIGKATASKIVEYLETGAIKKLDELRAKHPDGVVELMRIEGMGAKTVGLLREVLGVESVDDLRAAIDSQKLRDLPGFGPKTEENLRQALDRGLRTGHDQRAPVGDVMPVAEALVGALRAVTVVVQAEYAGSLRRMRETIGDVDVLVASKNAAAVTKAFVAMPLVGEVVASGATKTTVLTTDGIQVDLRIVAPAEFGAAMVYFTGSKAHNIALRQRALDRGWTLNEYSLSQIDSEKVVAAASEEEIYAALDLEWVPPPMREDTGELESAAAGTLPEVATVSDLKGDLHTHTTYSGDGQSELEAMVDTAAARGFEYYAVTDHAEDLRINGVNRVGMREQRKRMRKLGDNYPAMRLLHGAELNIDERGRLDYDKDFLATFDWGVASVHSSFRLSRVKQTARVIRAIEHPSVNAIGHLTARRIGSRAGIDLDFDAVWEAAARTGTAIEVNASLHRLDAPADLLRSAAAAGVTFVISTDSHHTRELDNAKYGVWTAQRGWVPREQVANTWDRDRFLEWVGAKRGRQI